MSSVYLDFFHFCYFYTIPAHLQLSLEDLLKWIHATVFLTSLTGKKWSKNPLPLRSASRNLLLQTGGEENLTRITDMLCRLHRCSAQRASICSREKRKAARPRKGTGCRKCGICSPMRRERGQRSLCVFFKHLVQIPINLLLFVCGQRYVEGFSSLGYVRFGRRFCSRNSSFHLLIFPFSFFEEAFQSVYLIGGPAALCNKRRGL